jgi:aspartate carbamoyltransferase catalytic subunit
MITTPFRHFLTLEGLQKHHLMRIMETADGFFDPNTGSIRDTIQLSGKVVATLFFEASTRTRSTFELAAKKLGAHILNLDMGHSSAKKGETLRDTVRNLEAMQCDYFVVRHPTSGAAHFIAEQVKPHIRVINAGDGRHAHPTQAMLDMYTIRKHRPEPFQDLCFAIVGDVLHSRVARSQIQALHLLHAGEIRVIAPKTLLPVQVESLGVRVFHNLQEGLEGVDVIMMLRLQMERMQGTLLPETDAFYREYGLTEKTLQYANTNALIIHPGPINRGVEIQSEIADGPQAVILNQVTNGIAIRMAILSLLE